MKNNHNLKDINAIFDNERNELLTWIPLLIKEKLNTLSTEQLRTLHYILGYNCKEESTESLIEEFEGYRYHKYVVRCIKQSERYKQIEEINRNYYFYTIDSNYYFERVLNSKQQFYKFDSVKYVKDCIYNNPEHYSRLVEEIKKNKRAFPLYKKAVNKAYKMCASGNCLTPDFYYRRLERKLLKSLLKHPVTEVRFLCYWSYTSPQGRNDYYNEKTFSFASIQRFTADAMERERIKKEREMERRLLSSSLRYDILKRDDFKCTICGRSAKDGIQLHVDHILPVAKGGKTVPENLRTLCNDCNLGKSDKYDKKGKN